MTKEERFRYYASREWALLKEEVKGRSGGRCERCKVGPHESTHHLTYERFGCELLEDLLGVCEACHEWLSGKSQYDPALEEEPDYLLTPIYAYPHPWVDYHHYTFDDPKTEDSEILLKCIDDIGIRHINEEFTILVPFFGCVPKRDFPGTEIWAAKSFGCVRKMELGVQFGGVVACRERLDFLGIPYLFAEKTFPGFLGYELLRYEELSSKDKLGLEDVNIECRRSFTEDQETQGAVQ